MSANDPNNPGQWQPQDWEPRQWSGNSGSSSLGDSSLDDAQPHNSSSSPNPFSREGSAPGDELGAGPDSAPPSSAGSASGYPTSAGSAAQPSDGTTAWPSYPANDPAPQDPQPGYDNNTQGYGNTQGYDTNQGGYAQPQSYPSANSYGSASEPYPQVPPYPGTQQPYADNAPGGYDTSNAYGSDQYGSNQYGANQYGSNQYGANPYDVNPYQGAYGAGSPYGVPAINHPQATTAMVLGIVGLVVCPFVGIAGLVMGNKARKEIDANPQQYSGRGMATAGFVLGILATVYSVLVLIYIIVIIGVGVSGGFE